MSNCPTITLNEVADRYCIYAGDDTRKYLKRIQIIAKDVWTELFAGTMMVVNNEYMELKKGDPYNYIDIPSTSTRVLSVGVPDKCGNLKPLFYNQNLVTIKKPDRKPCGCDACDCGGLCEAIGGIVVNTKDVVIINPDASPPAPQIYTEYQWLKYCPNGDIYEYRQIPTLKYTFSPGAYDDSYDLSYEIGETGSSVVVINLSRKLCTLEVSPCGCPVQNENNEKCFFEHCGCYLNTLNPAAVRRNKLWMDCNFWAGECKMSDCGTKIDIKWVENIDKNHHLLLSYQTNGINVNGNSQVPNNVPTKLAMYAGIDAHKMMVNSRFTRSEKEGSMYAYIDKQNKLIEWMNPLSTEWARSLPDVAVW